MRGKNTHDDYPNELIRINHCLHKFTQMGLLALTSLPKKKKFALDRVKALKSPNNQGAGSNKDPKIINYRLMP